MAYFLLHAGQPSAKRLIKSVTKLRSYVASNTLLPTDVVIRFGSTNESDPPEVTVMNPLVHIGRTNSRPAMGRFLRRVGVRFAMREASDPAQAMPQFTRHYRVPMFDLNPLACFRSDASPVWLNQQRIQRVQESFREISFSDEKVTMRVTHLAMRTLHALGLDFGMVSIGMTPKGVLHVVDVTPTPVMEGRMLELFSKAVKEKIVETDKALSTTPTLGTDMEVMLRNPAGKMVLASNYFTRRGRIGCDDRSIQFDGKRLPLMELRPEPDQNPIGLLTKLRETMVEAAVTINRVGVQWRAGSMPFRPYCTGGHIHFSNVPFSARFVKVLDNYIGLPLVMVEDPRTAQLRRPRYGFLGDVRMKDHGGFEYRTPSSFVVDMDVTAAAFCLAYLVALHYRELPVTDMSDPGIQQAFYRNDRNVLLPIAQRHMVYIRSLAAYERYRDYIEPLYKMIEEGKTWDETVDVRLVWGVPLARTEPKVVQARRRSVVGARHIG